MTILNKKKTRTIAQVAKTNNYSSRTIVPSEYARATYLDRTPKLEAFKLLLFLANIASDDLSADTTWSVKLSEINEIQGLRRHSEAQIRQLCNHVMQANICYDHPSGWGIGTVMDHIRTNHKDKSRNDKELHFKFGEFFRELSKTSNQYTVIKSTVANQFSSKYALSLYQHIQSLVNLKYQNSIIKTPDELKAIVAISYRRSNTLTTSHFYGRILKPAIDQINNIDPNLFLQLEPLRSGQRKIKNFRLTWETLESRKEANKKMAIREFDHSQVIEN